MSSLEGDSITASKLLLMVPVVEDIVDLRKHDLYFLFISIYMYQQNSS